MNTGKEMCEVLKSMRKKIAEQYGLVYEPTECNHEGSCQGTCPRCDAELRDLQRQLEEKGVRHIDFDNMMDAEVEMLFKKQQAELQELRNDDRLQGMPGPPILPTGLQVLEGEIQAPAEYFTRYERTLYKSCAVAGINFHDIDEIWEELYVGAEIALVRDKNNKHDKNAVAVALAGDYGGDPDDFDFDFILGYLPRTENEHIAMMLDMGWSDIFECEISELNDHRPYNDRLHIDIYIKSNKEQKEQHRDQLRAFGVDEATYNKIASDLTKMGNTYFRWGGFPPWERSLPTTGDNVVFIHRRDSECALYLMHLIATGDDAEPFVKDKEELHMVDDCMHYVFTNVKGPIIIKQQDAAFLDEETIDDVQPEEYLSKEASKKIIEIFDNIK
jgi:hypothetical protein